MAARTVLGGDCPGRCRGRRRVRCRGCCEHSREVSRACCALGPAPPAGRAGRRPLRRDLVRPPGWGRDHRGVRLVLSASAAQPRRGDSAGARPVPGDVGHRRRVRGPGRPPRGRVRTGPGRTGRRAGGAAAGGDAGRPPALARGGPRGGHRRSRKAPVPRELAPAGLPGGRDGCGGRGLDIGGPPAPVGTRVPLDGDNVAIRVLRTQRPARIDDYTSIEGMAADYVRSVGVRAAVGAPIVVRGRLWGVMVVGSSRPQPLPADTEMRIDAFSELVATAIANTAARTELEQVAAEQAALGRVATLVAEAVPPGDVFTAVAAEVAGLFGVPLVGLFRYEREGVATVIAGAGKVSTYLGRLWPCPAGDPGLVASLQRTGQPLRIDDYRQIRSVISASEGARHRHGGRRSRHRGRSYLGCGGGGRRPRTPAVARRYPGPSGRLHRTHGHGDRE